MQVTVGVDLVQLSSFAEQLALPGSRFLSFFAAAEKQQVAQKGELQATASLAARWAAKEAFLKAWSNHHYGNAASTIQRDAFPWSEVWVAQDSQGRTSIEFSPQIKQLLGPDFAGASVSLSHDGDYATATVIIFWQ